MISSSTAQSSYDLSGKYRRIIKGIFLALHGKGKNSSFCMHTHWLNTQEGIISGDYNSIDMIRLKLHCHFIWLNSQYIWLENYCQSNQTFSKFRSQTVIISSGYLTLTNVQLYSYIIILRTYSTCYLSIYVISILMVRILIKRIP